MRYLANWRMQLAKQMMREGARNIQEVATRVGYDSEAAFNRAFKRATGSPPATGARDVDMKPKRTELVRGLTLVDTTALVVGTVIGTGVFIKSAIMAQDAGSPLLVLAAWVAAGLLSLAGALSYAELGAMLPHAGGEYVYLRRSYGDLAAFLYGWMRFVVAGTGSIAILGVGFATFLSALVPIQTVWAQSTFTACSASTMHWQFGATQAVAMCAITLFAIVNCLTVVVGGRVQTALTILKIAGIGIVVFGIAFLSRRPTGRTWRRPRPAMATAAARRPSGSRCWRRSGPMTGGTTCRWRRERSRTPAATCHAP